MEEITASEKSNIASPACYLELCALLKDAEHFRSKFTKNKSTLTEDVKRTYRDEMAKIIESGALDDVYGPPAIFPAPKAPQAPERAIE